MTELRTQDRDAGRPAAAIVAETAGREAARARARELTSLISRNAAIVVLFLVVVVGFVGVPTFGSADNLRNVALAASSIGIIAAGMTFVIISGGIDLSVGSTYALAVITSAYFAKSGSFVAVAGALACAAAVGLVQGLIISYLRLPPFIVTLAGLTAIRGVVYFITDEGNDHPLVPKGRTFEVFGTGELATVKMPVWIMLVIFALGWFLLNRTAFGQTAQAVGDSETAAL